MVVEGEDESVSLPPPTVALHSSRQELLHDPAQHLQGSPLPNLTQQSAVSVENLVAASVDFLLGLLRAGLVFPHTLLRAG